MRSLLACTIAGLLAQGAPPAPTTGPTAARRSPDVFDVKDFGAHSTTEPGYEHFDSTGAIQAAVDALIASGGGVLKLPFGTYDVSAPIDISRTAGAEPGLVKLEAKRDWGYAKDFVEAMWLTDLELAAREQRAGAGPAISRHSGS